MFSFKTIRFQRYYSHWIYLNCFFFCFSFFFSFVANAFPSSGQESKGPDPLIKLVVHPQEHVIVPVRSFVLLHCEANFTDYPELDYENDDMNAYFPNEGDYMQNDEPNDDLHQQSIDSREGTTTNWCQQEVQYEWLRNGIAINDPNNSFTQTFCNGSIKIIHSANATATYRCVASTTKPDVGAVVSKASHVKAAGKDNFCGKFLHASIL